MVYDSRSPAAGVRVAPMCVGGQDKVQGLSMAQAKAKRNTNPLTPEHLKGGCFKQGNGCFARTIKATRSPYEFKRSGHGCYRTPGRKGPGQATKRKTNTICRTKIPTLAMREEIAALDMDRVVSNAFRKISQQHAGMIGAGADGDVKLYDERRALFLERHPTLRAKLDEREAAHRNTIVVGRSTERQQIDQSVSDHRSIAAKVRVQVQALNDARKAAVRVVHTYQPEPSNTFVGITYA